MCLGVSRCVLVCLGVWGFGRVWGFGLSGFCGLGVWGSGFGVQCFGFGMEVFLDEFFLQFR